MHFVVAVEVYKQLAAAYNEMGINGNGPIRCQKGVVLLGLFHIATSTRRQVLAESTRLRVLVASTFRIDASEFKAGNTLCVIFCCCKYYCLVFVGRVT